MHHIPCKALLAFSIVAASSVTNTAQAGCTTPSPECAVVGKWEISASLGGGQRSNPIAGKSDIPLVVIPHVSYYGKRFFLENLEAGYTLHEGEANTLSLVAAPGYDRVFFYRHDLQNIFIPGGTTVLPGGSLVLAGGTVLPGSTTLPSGTVIPAAGKEFPVGSRHTTWLAGPEWTFGVGPISGQLNALYEFTGEHEGHEVRGALAAPVLRGKGSLVASAGFTWKSAELVRYYYGVDQLYEPGSAFNPFVKLQYSLPLTDRWTITAFGHYERLAGSIARSPVVVEDHVTTVFAGAAFRIR